MSTLSVSSIQNPAASQANISLNADGSVTLPVYTSGTAPALLQPGTLWFNTTGPALQIRDTTNTGWISVGGGSAGVGSWSGGTTGLTPAAATTGAITLGGILGVANGGTGQTTAQGAIDALLPSQGGNAGKYLTTNGTNTAWSTTPLNGPASLAEAATGTINTKYSSPETAVPKTSAGMTGFVILPSSAAAPATTTHFHYNTTSNHLEYFAAAAAKTVVEREGDNMTGKLSVTPSAIAAGVGGWNLAVSNYWTLGAVAVPLPTGLVAGQGGLIEVTAVPTSWPAAGGILKYAGGTAPVIATPTAIIPYYCDGTNVYLGKATENIS